MNGEFERDAELSDSYYESLAEEFEDDELDESKQKIVEVNSVDEILALDDRQVEEFDSFGELVHREIKYVLPVEWDPLPLSWGSTAEFSGGLSLNEMLGGSKERFLIRAWEVKNFYYLFPKGDIRNPPWHLIGYFSPRIIANLKPISSMDAPSLFATLCNWPGPESRKPTRLNNPTSSGMELFDYVQLVAYRFSLLKIAVDRDANNPSPRGSRVLLLLKRWGTTANNGDASFDEPATLRTLRDRALQQLKRKGEEIPLYEDIRHRVHEMFVELEMQAETAKECCEWIRTGRGPRAGTGDELACRSPEKIDYCVKWFNQRREQIEKWCRNEKITIYARDPSWIHDDCHKIRLMMPDPPFGYGRARCRVYKEGTQEPGEDDRLLSPGEVQTIWDAHPNIKPWEVRWHLVFVSMYRHRDPYEDWMEWSAAKVLNRVRWCPTTRRANSVWRLNIPDEYRHSLHEFVECVKRRYLLIRCAVFHDEVNHRRGKSRVTRMLSRWDLDDKVRQLRNDVIAALRHRHETAPFYEDVLTAVREMFIEFETRKKLGREIGLWIETATGPRNGLEDPLELKDHDRFGWYVSCLEEHYKPFADWIEKTSPGTDGTGGEPQMFIPVTISQVAKAVDLQPGSMTKYVKAWGDPEYQRKGKKHPSYYDMDAIWDVLMSQFDKDSTDVSNLKALRESQKNNPMPRPS